MKTENDTLCYLCGKMININELKSKDHVIPQQFIKRKQPRVKGFDYGGFLPTHLECNNMFGGLDGKSEFICQKALRLISIYHQKDNLSLTDKNDPNTSILLVQNTELKDFSEKEIQYFRIVNTYRLNNSDWLNPKYYKNKKPFNPLEKPINAAYSVLAKSISALLVKRYNINPKNFWRIAANLFISSQNDLYLPQILGNIKPFDNGLKVWIKQFEDIHWFSVFQYKFLSVWFFFIMNSDNLRLLNQWNKKFARDSSTLYYEGKNLLNMIGYNWVANKIN